MTAEPVKKYTLMHKNIAVVDLKLDPVTGTITSIGDIHEENHVPVGIRVKEGKVDRGMLNEWWKGRSIPASRAGLQEALMKLGETSSQQLLEKCLGLSLSDQYWICPAESELRWEQVNFFQNPFSEDVGNILLGKDPGSVQISLISPDNTSDGWLKKKWTIQNGKRCLLKGGSGATRQEPYNEVLASRIMDRLQIPHVSYSLWMEEEYPYSICEDFITPDTELISAWRIMQTAKKPNHISLYQYYLDCCERLNIPDVEKSLNWMLVLDYLIVNEDRHFNNFGVIRRADTLEYVGAAPIYDSGTSLWFDKPLQMIHGDVPVTCKPFKISHEEQIKLVTDFSWLEFSALKGLDEELREIVKGSLFIDDARCEALCRGFNQRISMLEEVVCSAKKQVFIDDKKYDVTQDIAYSGEK